MIVEYVRYAIDSQRATGFVRAYHEAGIELMKSDYALRFEICRCVEDEEQFTVRIEWTSVDDHLMRFRGSAEFKAFLEHVRPFIGDILEMRHYEVLSTLPTRT